MSEPKRFSLVKPTVHTPFSIDFDWWQTHDRDWRVYLRGYLSAEDRSLYSDIDDEEMVDIVDTETGEVHAVDGLQHIIISQYAGRDDFITQSTSISEAIFRILLAGGNAPMSPAEMGEKIGRDPDIILRLLSGRRVHKGIRPASLSA